MKFFQSLPLSQKIMVIAAIAAGLFVLVCWTIPQFSLNTRNDFILFYGLGLPLFLFLSPAIMSLNNKNIFLFWLIFSFLLLIIYLLTLNNDTFLIQRSAKFINSSGINSWIADHSTSALKTLFFFLIVYWPLNQYVKKKTGNFIVSTYKKITWFNEDANRRITKLDVVANVILFVTIICAGVF